MLIRKKLPLLMILQVSIPLIFLGVIVYLYISNHLMTISKDNIKELTRIQSDELNALISEQKREIDLTAEKASVKELLIEEKNYPGITLASPLNSILLDNELGRRVDKLPEVQHSFVADTDGIIISDSNSGGKGQSINDMEYFVQAMRGKTAISNTITSKIDEKLVIVIASPVKDEAGHIIGIVGNAIYTDYFQDFTSKIRVGKTGYAYLLDYDGLIIAHPDREKIGKPIDQDKIMSIVKNIRNLRKSDISMDTYNYNNKEKLMGFITIPDVKWTLVVVQEINEVKSTSNRALQIITTLVFIMIIVSLFISLLVLRRIIVPIQKMLTYIKKAALGGDLTLKLEYKSEDEFGILADNFNEMMVKLNCSYEELSAVYEELAATEEALRVQYDELVLNQEILEQSEEKYKQIACYDPLTQLYNKAVFFENLEAEIMINMKKRNIGALLFIDLDDFKVVNDSLGHDIGDCLLKMISEAFVLCSREGDVICRFGGDEFLILRMDIKTKAEAEAYASSILKVFDSPFEIGEKQIYITASIGISVFPCDGMDKNIILKNADTAMYKAKEEGKNRYQLYNKEMSKILLRKIKLEKILRRAIETKELYLNYQPQVDLTNRKIVGVEALMRLSSEELGFVSPAEFIPLAEETGLIVPLGYWIFRTACEQYKHWKDSGSSIDYVSVNVSSVQIQQYGFSTKVIDIIKEAGIPPQAIEIEITESILMKALESNVKILEELRQFGIRIALDDFGTGYSSLNYIRSLPLDTLKIDKCFIDNICHDPIQESIVDGVLHMAQKMEIEVVAEGVEDHDQLALLEAKNCDKVQGYVFSKPVSADEIVKLCNQVSDEITRKN